MGPRLRPQTGWDRKSLQADPGRLQTRAPAGRACRGLGLLFRGVWCPRAGESRSQPRVGGGVVVRRVKGRRRLPESRTALNGRAVGVTAGSSLGQPLRGLPKPGDTSCVIISVTVRYIRTRCQHGVRHLPKWRMSQRPCREQRQTPLSGGGRASGRAGAQACRPHTGRQPLCGRGRSSAPRSRFPHL